MIKKSNTVSYTEKNGPVSDCFKAEWSRLEDGGAPQGLHFVAFKFI